MGIVNEQEEIDNENVTNEESQNLQERGSEVNAGALESSSSTGGNEMESNNFKDLQEEVLKLKEELKLMKNTEEFKIDEMGKNIVELPRIKTTQNSDKKQHEKVENVSQKMKKKERSSEIEKTSKSTGEIDSQLTNDITQNSENFQQEKIPQSPPFKSVNANIFHTSSFSERFDVLERKGIFKKVNNLFRVVKIVSDQQDSELRKKALIEKEQIYGMCREFGYGYFCHSDASVIDFVELNKTKLEFIGVYGTKDSMKMFLKRFPKSETIVKELNENVVGGIYIWVYDITEYKGIVFIWPGNLDYFDENSKHSMLNTLIRYVFELATNEVILVVNNDEQNDLDVNYVEEFRQRMFQGRGVTIKKTTKEDRFSISKNGLILLTEAPEIRLPDRRFIMPVGKFQASYFTLKKSQKTLQKREKGLYLHKKEDLFKFFKNFNVNVVNFFNKKRLGIVASFFPYDTEIFELSKAYEKVAAELNSKEIEEANKLEKRKKDKLIKEFHGELNALRCLVKRIYKIDGYKNEVSDDSEIYKRISEIKELEESVKCSICLESYKDPVGLSCEHIHTFCRKCIKKHITTVKSSGSEFFHCPRCRNTHDISINLPKEQNAMTIIDRIKEKVKQLDDLFKILEKRFKMELKEIKKGINKMKKDPVPFDTRLRVVTDVFLEIKREGCSSLNSLTVSGIKNKIKGDHANFKKFIEAFTSATRITRLVGSLWYGSNYPPRKIVKQRIDEKIKEYSLREKDIIDLVLFEVCDKFEKEKRKVINKQLNLSLQSERRDIRSTYKDLHEKEWKNLNKKLLSKFKELSKGGKSVMLEVCRPVGGVGINSGFEIRYSFDVEVEGDLEGKLYTLFIDNLNSITKALSESGERSVVVKGYFHNTKEWRESINMKLLFFYEFRNTTKLLVFYNKFRKCTSVHLVHPSKSPCYDEKNVINRFQHKTEKDIPLLFCFEEIKGIFLVYRKVIHVKFDKKEYYDEIGIYKLDFDKRRLHYSKKIDLNTFFNPSKEPLLKNIKLIPKKTEAVLMKNTGELLKLSLVSGTLETLEKKRVIDLKKVKKLRMFILPDPLLVIVYWNFEKSVWVVEGCLLSNRVYDNGKKYFVFDPLSITELDKRHSINTIFSIYVNGAIKFLFLYDREEKSIFSYKLNVEVFESRIQQQVSFNVTKKKDIPRFNSLLDYFYFCFFKFPTKNGLSIAGLPKKDVLVLMESKTNKKKVNQYINEILGEIQNLGKNIKLDLNYSVEVKTLSKYFLKKLKKVDEEHDDEEDEEDDSDVEENDLLENNLFGNWLQILIGLIPIQIARHYFGEFKPLCDGMPIPFDEKMMNEEKDVLRFRINDFAKEIKFGLYDTILKNVNDKRIYVIACVGTQSSGKSTLLNNLTGAFFDVGAGRCTDGIWMQISVTKSRVYVLLDFEGLGSFEKTSEQDMLSSLFGAGISNVFIIRTTMHFDRFTKNTLGLWAKGARHLKFKRSKKLFSGKLYLNPRDVDPNSSEQVVNDFLEKFQKTLNDYEETIKKESDENQQYLVLEMFKEWVICPSAKNNTREYYSNLFKILKNEENNFRFKNGSDFLEISKLFLAQLTMKDFSSLDDFFIKTIIEDVEMIKNDAIYGGIVSPFPLSEINSRLIEAWKKNAQPLKSHFKSSKYLDDEDSLVVVLELEEVEISFIESVVKKLNPHYRNLIALDTEGKNINVKFSSLKDGGIVLGPVCSAEEIFKKDRSKSAANLLKRIDDTLEDLSVKWILCGQKCAKCFYSCCLRRGHSGNHDCFSDHMCPNSCEYCLKDENEKRKCKLPAGHQGSCHCAEKSHECGRECSLAKFFGKVFNILKVLGCGHHCVLKAGHEGECLCPVPKDQHLCGKSCSLEGCDERCIYVYHTNHDRHKCHRNKCPKKCELCSQECKSENHFHSLDSPDEYHLCGKEHSCEEVCEHEGICEVDTSRVFKKSGEIETYDGKKIKYEEYSEQNGKKNLCCIKISPDKVKHEGKHICIPPEREIEGSEYHFCKLKCKQCGYYCQKPFKHEGLCSCSHGNMRNAFLEVESGKSFDVIKVKNELQLIKAKASAVFLTCEISCSSKGRGHFHLVRCSHNSKEECDQANLLDENVRHQSCVYDENIVYDEVKCEFYWKHFLKFDTSFSDSDKKLFSLCSSQCPMEEYHNKEEDENDEEKTDPFCTETLWHPKLEVEERDDGIISVDGHFFPCTHEVKGNYGNYHTFLIFDNSGSMSYRDLTPRIFDWIKSNSLLVNRLGLVYEAMANYILNRKNSNKNDLVSLINFNSKANIVAKNLKVDISIIRDYCLNIYPTGGTYFLQGFRKAVEILNSCNLVGYTPVFILFSDGEDCGTKDHVIEYLKDLKEDEEDLIIHTIGFQSGQGTKEYMEKIAEIGDGSYHFASGAVQLVEAFELISKNPTKSSFVAK